MRPVIPGGIAASAWADAAGIPARLFQSFDYIQVRKLAPECVQAEASIRAGPSGAHSHHTRQIPGRMFVMEATLTGLQVDNVDFHRHRGSIANVYGLTVSRPSRHALIFLHKR